MMQRPSALPGTGSLPRAVFVGRNGALLANALRTSAPKVDAALFSAGATDALFRTVQAGFRVYLIGNEDAVAQGKISDAAWSRFESALLEHLRGLGIPVAHNYACLDHPRGKGEHKRDSVFLFPNTGALYHAAQEDGIDLPSSWLVSRDVLELAAGWRAGVRTVRLLDTTGAHEELRVEPSLGAPDLARALRQVVAASGVVHH